MSKKKKNKAIARLPMDYDVYVFDLYGTLVDIHTDEQDEKLWEKLCVFMGYYGARYKAQELKEAYFNLVKKKEANLKSTLENDPKYSHEASPEIDITEVFEELYTQKGVIPEENLVIFTGQMFRVVSTEYIRTYRGTEAMLTTLKNAGKKVYLLSNAQRIFTEYEIRMLDIESYFDGILISSDHKTKKPDKRFFDILIEKYGIKTKKTLFIGNDMRSDMQGAMSVGFDTFYVYSSISPKEDLKEYKDFTKNLDFLVSEFSEWYC